MKGQKEGLPNLQEELNYIVLRQRGIGKAPIDGRLVSM